MARHSTRKGFGRRVITPLALGAALWAVLTDGEPSSWLIGIPVVLGSTAISVFWRPVREWSLALGGILPFIAFFWRRSFIGGVDVARRALNPKGTVDPTLFSYEPRLPNASARLFFAGALNLLPGTFVVALNKRSLLVHTLDTSLNAPAELLGLERMVARLFGLPVNEGQEIP